MNVLGRIVNAVFDWPKAWAPSESGPTCSVQVQAVDGLVVSCDLRVHVANDTDANRRVALGRAIDAMAALGTGARPSGNERVFWTELGCTLMGVSEDPAAPVVVATIARADRRPVTSWDALAAPVERFVAQARRPSDPEPLPLVEALLACAKALIEGKDPGGPPWTNRPAGNRYVSARPPAIPQSWP